MTKTILAAVGAAVLTSFICFGLLNHFAGNGKEAGSTTRGTGVFNSAVAIAQSDIGRALQNELTKRFGKEETEWNQKVRILQEDKDNLDKQQNLTQAARDAKNAELLKRDRALAEQRNQLIAESNRVKQIMDSNVTRILIKACEQIGKKHNLDLILDTLRTGVTYLVPKYDLTAEMTNLLNELWRADGAKFSGLDETTPSDKKDQAPAAKGSK